tara:strand:+ start:3248 stop:4948 length:1701 start_codon:yes stop_codon:yes gene_type:complete
MKNYKIDQMINDLKKIISETNIITKPNEVINYSKGIRVGGGKAYAVLLPDDLLQFWKSLKILVKYEKIIIIQAANTGLTGGSTPHGDLYDRDVVIINTLKINKIILINEGKQIISLAGATLYELEDELNKISRSPHSVIGSSCIGASIVGGICNNSGGNLLNRGPAYTELSLYAELDEKRNLNLVNNLGIDLGIKPEEILERLMNSDFNKSNISNHNKIASDNEYQQRIRDTNASTPARFNSDERRLFEASGCAGKIAVFAVRVDTFPKAQNEQVFYIGTNDPNKLTKIRSTMLSKFKTLPEMGEYFHRSFFDASDYYCKDNFLAIKYMGASFLPKLFKAKCNLDNFFAKTPILMENISDKLLQCLSTILPDHLPKSLRKYRNKYEHHLIILASNECIDDTRHLLEITKISSDDFNYFECNKKESDSAMLLRYVAGAAPARAKIIEGEDVGEILPFDVALPRNTKNWSDVIDKDIESYMSKSFKMGHFFCMVFHWDFIVKPNLDANKVKEIILEKFDNINAKYPAEHNVGHLYKADENLSAHYKRLDPTNTFNSGIGRMSKFKNYN